MNPSDRQPSSPSDDLNKDEVLVEQCLRGDEDAWTRLVRKYANLIYSIPMRRGFDQDTAADIFQNVFAALLGSMRSIRQPRALASWLIQTTAHACDRVRNERQKWLNASREYTVAHAAVMQPEVSLEHLESEYIVHEAVAVLSGDCQKLIQLLFLNDPPVSYEDAAEQLGLAKGSIGATRMRCLEKLRRTLEEKGFTHPHGR